MIQGKKKKSHFLIIGSLPLPVGGVTIHVQRLLYHLEKNKISFFFLDLRKESVPKLIFSFLIYKKVHLHSSNVYLRFLIALVGSLTHKRVYMTIHGDLGRYSSRLLNHLDLLSLKMVYRPILLNKKSFEKAITQNNRSLLKSAFLPPNSNRESLNPIIRERVLKLKREKKNLFCTNAYNLAYDKNGEEIYGIFELVQHFREISKYGLIISDPSGAYHRELINRKIDLSSNILIISEIHSFFKIIELCDFTIRNTSTDGDSISVKESLYLEKGTLCTDVVSRPKGTICYKRGNIKSILKQKNLKEIIRESIGAKENFNIEVQQTIAVYTE